MTRIVSDFEEDLYLYRLPSFASIEIGKLIGNGKLYFVSEKITSSHIQEIEIFWGHKPSIDIIKRFPNLKWIHLGTSGYEKLDLRYCFNQGIVVTISNKLNSSAVALTAISFLLDDLRGTSFDSRLLLECGSDKNEMRRSFESRFPFSDRGEARKVLVLGYGAIGKRLLRYLDGLSFDFKAVDSTCVYYSNLLTKNYSQKSDLAEYVSEADYIVNCLPSSPSTNGFVDDNFINWMKDSSYYISVGRSSTTDSEALLNGIIENKIRGAALDVFDDFSTQKFKQLVYDKRISFLPHVAGFYRSYWDVQVKFFNENLSRYLKSQELIGRLI